MIVYNKEFDLNLDQYGIQVPILDDRSLKCFIELQKEFKSVVETSLNELSTISKEDLLRVHSKDLVERFYSKKRDELIIECYELIDKNGNFHRYDPEIAKKKLSTLVDKFILQTRGTYHTFKSALKDGFSFGLCGGMHHAMSDRPRGFCLINDIVIAARKLQSDVRPLNISVIDIDAHKGCGTAEITENDSTIETLSIHMKEGWPLSKECGDGPWRIPSSIDIEIGINEEELYLDKLSKGLESLENLDFAIVVAGADPYEGDILESASEIQLSKEKMLERDLLVYRFLKSRNIPQAWIMAGGYGPKTWEIYYQFLKLIHEEEHA